MWPTAVTMSVNSTLVDLARVTRFSTSHLFKSAIAFRVSKANQWLQRRNSGNSQGQDEDEKLKVFGYLKDRVINKLGNRLNDLKKQNAFQLFDIQQGFRIDERKLRNEMLKMQNILHPDRYVDKDKASQDMSDTLSSMVNDYYRILRNPYERAKYLLSLTTNKSMDDIESSLDQIKLDSEFLTRMMETREQLEELESGDKEIARLNISIEDEIHQIISDITTKFEDKKHNDVLKLIAKLKFLANCQKISGEKTDGFGEF